MLRTRNLLPILVLALAPLAACGDDPAATAAPAPTTGPPTTITAPASSTTVPLAGGPTTTRPAALADGTHSGVLRRFDGERVALETRRVLSGQEAVDAARRAGMIGDGEDLPNDVFVDDSAARAVELPVSATIDLKLYDCRTGCELVDVAVEEWVTGDVTAYGGATPMVDVLVRDGEVVAITEVYLP